MAQRFKWWKTDEPTTGGQRLVSNGNDGLFVPDRHVSIAKDWDAVFGTPVFSASSLGASGQRTSGMMFDSAAQETAFTFMPLPNSEFFDVWLLWANPSAVPGNVVWQCGYERSGWGALLDEYVTHASVTAAAPAQNTVGRTRILTAGTRGSAEFVGLKFGRRGDLAADTVDAQDVGAIAVYIEPAVA